MDESLRAGDEKKFFFFSHYTAHIAIKSCNPAEREKKPQQSRNEPQYSLLFPLFKISFHFHYFDRR
jgi:hypothetical protein